MKRLLIIDDRSALRRLMRWTLQGLGFEVEIHEAAGRAAPGAIA